MKPATISRRLAVCALAIPAVLVGIACGGGATDTASKGAADPQVKLPGLNTPVRDGMFEFLVTDVKCGVPSVGRDLSKSAQGQYCLVTMSVKNTGTEARSLSASNQRAFGPDKVRYEADSLASYYASPNGETFWTEINPGNQVTGVVAFDIPKNAQLLTLELHDSAYSGGVAVRVG